MSMTRAFDPNRRERWDEDRQRMIREFFERKQKLHSVDDDPFFDDKWRKDEVPLTQKEQSEIDQEEEWKDADDRIEELETELKESQREHDVALKSAQKKTRMVVWGLMAAVIVSVVSVIGYSYQIGKRNHVERKLDDAHTGMLKLESEVSALSRELQIL